MDIVVTGPINSLGYGVVCASVVHELSQHFRVGLDVIGGEIQPEDIFPFESHVQRSVNKARELWRDNPIKAKRLPHLHIWHEWDLGGEWTGPTIGMPFFETTPLLEAAVPKVTDCDLVVVPSKWAADVVTSSAPKATVAYVKYAGYDPKVYHPRLIAPRTPGLLHVGKLEVRKGIDLVLKAFGQVYRDYPGLNLYCLIDNPFMPKWYGLWLEMITDAGIENDPVQRVFCLRRRETQRSMATLFRKMSGGIQPARGEGWGLCTQEMLACGLPVATTNNTGHAEFVEEMNATVIPSGPLERAADGFFFTGDRSWYSVSLEDVVKGMLEVINSPKVPVASPDLTWAAGVNKLVTTLKERKMI